MTYLACELRKIDQEKSDAGKAAIQIKTCCAKRPKVLLDRIHADPIPPKNSLSVAKYVPSEIIAFFCF